VSIRVTKTFRLTFHARGSATLRVENAHIEQSGARRHVDAPVDELPFAALRSMFVSRDQTGMNWPSSAGAQGAQNWSERR